LEDDFDTSSCGSDSAAPAANDLTVALPPSGSGKHAAFRPLASDRILSTLAASSNFFLSTFFACS
jgi:hypothetical protein